jgi:hypothetical protein
MPAKFRRMEDACTGNATTETLREFFVALPLLAGRAPNSAYDAARQRLLILTGPVGALASGGVRVSLVKAGRAAKQRAGLPDAREWSTTLALALIQALLGQRAVSQAIRENVP